MTALCPQSVVVLCGLRDEVVVVVLVVVGVVVGVGGALCSPGRTAVSAS